MDKYVFCCLRTTLIGLAFVLQTGCGGGTNIAEGGISGTGKTIAGTGRSNGPISGKGSIITNGVKFNTNDAIIRINGEENSDTSLEVGMIVSINGEFNTEAGNGIADTVDFEYSLFGRIEKRSENIIESNGQILEIDQETRFSNTSDPELTKGDFISASGFIGSDGEILATYIEKVISPPPSYIIVDGIVEDLNLSSKTFRIKNKIKDADVGAEKQLVSYINAAILDFDSDTLANGSYIHIEGDMVNSVINATLIKNKKGSVNGPEGDGFLLQGIVNKVVESDTFLINGNSISIGPDTIIVDGNKPDIKEGAKLQIVGVIDDKNRLKASQIFLLNKPTTEIEAPVTAVNTETGELTLLGLSITPNLFTVLLDESSANVIPFSVNDISLNDRLVIRFHSTSAELLATKIIRIDNTGDNSAFIEGPVTGIIADPEFQISGVPIDTKELPENGVFSKGELVPLTKSEFFRDLREGMRVKVSGLISGVDFTPSSVALQIWGNFTMLDPAGNLTGGTNDVFFDWYGTLYTDPATQTAPNIIMGSVLPTPFFGFPWIVHDARAFGPGSYSFTTTRGNTLTLNVGENQVGVHLLFDWNASSDIDMVLLWNVDGIFEGSSGTSSDLGAKGKFFNFASTDGDGDGIPGIPMADGPFEGFQPNFNVSIPSPLP